MPSYYSYKMVRDYGFAPNPFHGFCSLATCKPRVRKKAIVGDWIIGTGSVANGLLGRLIYLMKVTKKISFEEYSTSKEYKIKVPTIPGNLEQVHGDNIYSQNENGDWIQTLSQHSSEDNTENQKHKKTDLSGKFVLLSDDFFYFGNRHLLIPAEYKAVCSSLRDFFEIKDANVAEEFIDYIRFNYPQGRIGLPIDWREYSQMSLFDIF